MTIESNGHLFIIAQTVLFYLCSGLTKKDPSWFNGSAVQFVLHFDFMRTTHFNWLSQFPKLTHGLTYITLFLEIVGAFFLIIFTCFTIYICNTFGDQIVSFKVTS